jgi:trk system potassium uptake protein TrkH
MNFKVIIHLTGSVLVIISAFMLSGVIVSVIYDQPDLLAMSLSVFITLVSGLIMHFATKSNKKEPMRHRDVFGSVTICWLTVSLFGALPYILSGTFDSFTNAYFEAVSGFTTTGATVITDIEAMPLGVLFWRHMTQWIGGMGIILFALAVLPFLGSGGLQLFKAEAPEITVDRLRPRIIDTAKVLWYIYAFFTFIAFLLYLSGGMSVYDALCHALTTLATGGFSTKNASLAHFDSRYIEGVATLLMFMAGVNYSLYFSAFKGKLGRFWESSEFRFYIGVTFTAIALITWSELGETYQGIGQALRFASFQAVSITTGTGYTTADYEGWRHFSQILLVILMFFGGMIGSTSGGMKQVRVLLMLKQGYRELYQLIHPHAVTTVKLDNKPYSKELLGSIWGFLFLFLMMCVLGTLALSAMGIDYITSVSTVISAMSNVGPALGQAGPTENYFGLPTAAKWVLAFLMLVGRLEVYTVIILFVPHFWKK